MVWKTDQCSDGFNRTKLKESHQSSVAGSVTPTQTLNGLKIPNDPNAHIQEKKHQTVKISIAFFIIII